MAHLSACSSTARATLASQPTLYRAMAASTMTSAAPSSPASSQHSRSLHWSARRSAESAADSEQPLPPANIPSRTTIATPMPLVGPSSLNRLEEHYRRTLATDLLYMTYDSAARTAGVRTEDGRFEGRSQDADGQSAADRQRSWDESSPYTKNRPTRPQRGNRALSPLARPLHLQDPTQDLVKLERVIITTFCSAAIVNKHALVPLVAQMRAITGLTALDSHADPTLSKRAPRDTLEAARSRGYIDIIRSKKSVAVFKLRRGMPVGVKAVLPGPVAQQFLEILVTFVLPRLRTFNGFALPSGNEPPSSPANVSGTVSLGMPPDAMALFPQTEVNWDMYPGKPLGFQIDCLTNQRGPRATERARTLLSGMGIPFVRRTDLS